MTTPQVIKKSGEIETEGLLIARFLAQGGD
jgi:hypothetical protein